MQAPGNPINTYNQVFKLYRYTRVQAQKDTAIKVLNNKLIELIKGIIDNTPTVSQSANQLKSQLNAKVKSLKEQLALAQGDNTDIDVAALKVSLVTYYRNKNDDEPKGADFIKFLNDECDAGGEPTEFAIAAPRSMFEILAERNGIHIPTAHEMATGNYEYNRGQFGSSSSYLRYTLEGIAADEITLSEGPKGPDDADDLSRCVFYVEEYLRRQNRASLTAEEMGKISAISRNWAGIMEHWNALSQAINTHIPFADVKTLLHECMNGAKTIYGDDEAKQITAAEAIEIAEFSRNLALNNTTDYNLKGRSRVFANQLIKTLHANRYYVEYSFENKGMVNGSMPLSRGRMITYLNKTDFNQYAEKSLVFRPRTAADDVDAVITRETNRGFTISF